MVMIEGSGYRRGDPEWLRIQALKAEIVALLREMSTEPPHA